MPCFGVGGENFWVFLLGGEERDYSQFDFELKVFITLKFSNGAEKVINITTLTSIRHRFCMIHIIAFCTSSPL